MLTDFSANVIDHIDLSGVLNVPISGIASLKRSLKQTREQTVEGTTYQLLLIAAMTGDGARFTHDDTVKLAMAIVDPILDTHHQVHSCNIDGWRLEQTDALIVRDESWLNPRFTDAAAY